MEGSKIRLQLLLQRTAESTGEFSLTLQSSIMQFHFASRQRQLSPFFSLILQFFWSDLGDTREIACKNNCFDINNNNIDYNYKIDRKNEKTLE